MRFVIHVGPHKTGTTYLQEGFVRMRGALAGRGVHFPAWWGPVAQYDLLEKLRAPPNAEAEAQFAELRAAGHQTVLISVEGLLALPRPGVAYLRHLIGDAEVTVVFYTRSWADLLPSTWQEIVKEGAVLTLPEFLYARLANPLLGHETNFGPHLQNYVEEFGADAVRLVSYDQLAADKLDLFRHFAHWFLGWSDPPDLRIGRVNTSLTPHDSEVMRALNAIDWMRAGRRPPPQYARKMGETYLRLKPDIVGPALAEALKAQRNAVRVDEKAPAALGLHRALYSEFQHHLTAPRPPQLFFNPRSVDVAYIHPNYLTYPGVVDDLHAMHRTLAAALQETARSEAAARPDGDARGAPRASRPPAARELVAVGPPGDANASDPAAELVVIFRKGGNSEQYLAGGWSPAEPEHRWTAAPEARLLIPRPAQPGDHVLTALLRPFVAADRLPAQRLVVEANGTRLGEVALRRASQVTVLVPAAVLAQGADGLALRLLCPDAARPVDVKPGALDDRLLGFAFERLSVAGAAGHVQA